MIYTTQQWIEDFDYVVRLPFHPGATPISVSDHSQTYFYSKYQDEWADRFARFEQAMRFLDQHLDDLDFGKAAVAGEKEAGVGRPLVLALHEYFTSLSSEEIDKPPTTEEIIRLAIKHGA